MNVLTFAADNPLTAICLSLPVAAILCTFAWCFATAVVATWSTLVSGLTTGLALLVTLIRGYPPQKVTLADLKAPAAEPSAQEQTDTSDKPLAS